MRFALTQLARLRSRAPSLWGAVVGLQMITIGPCTHLFEKASPPFPLQVINTQSSCSWQNVHIEIRPRLCCNTCGPGAARCPSPLTSPHKQVLNCRLSSRRKKHRYSCMDMDAGGHRVARVGVRGGNHSGRDRDWHRQRLYRQKWRCSRTSRYRSSDSSKFVVDIADSVLRLECMVLASC